MPAVVEATRSYERWLARHVDIVRADLRHKHLLMRRDPITFLRATYYRWVELWPGACGDLAAAPRVLGAGDLHVENFGTWRDAEGRLAWGVNDLDEASVVPYTNDLVRLATSACLAGPASKSVGTIRRACAAILDGYAASLARGGRPIVLAERHRWLRQIAAAQLKDPVAFWDRLAANPRVPSLPPGPRRLVSLPADATDIRVFRRQAGAGSLGRPRFVLLASSAGGLIGREAKAVVPPATAWFAETREPSHSLDLHRRAVRAIDPFFTSDGRWTVRRLSPDCSKIELNDVARPYQDDKLLRAMGWETANLHLATPRAPIGRDLARRPPTWLAEATTAMLDVVRADYREWRARTAR